MTFTLNSPTNKYYPVSSTVSARGCADINGTPTAPTLPNDSLEISFRGWLTVPIIGSTSGVTIIRQALSIFDTPTASFTAGAPAGNTVNFTNTSSGSSTQSWDFGDGNTSTLANPSHTYAGPGNYNVCLIVDNGNCTDTTCSLVTIGCPAPAVVWNSVTTGLDVDFTDQTLGNPQSWLWDFGDGNTSTLQDPMHTYGSAGNYLVCLTVSDSCGTDSTCSTVSVCDLPVAGFTSSVSGDEAQFTNTSTSATTYAWDFGDGNTSTMQDPTHNYTATGDYTVCLISTSSCGVDTSCQTVSICLDPVPDFTFVDNSGTVDFSDASTTNGSVTYLWDFGDGGTSTIQNPTHTYSSVGMFTACLTVTDSCGSDSSCQTVDITMTSIDRVLIENLHLFPNPNAGAFTLQGFLTEGHAVTISVHDILGREIHRTEAGRISGAFRQEIGLGQVEPGLYFVKIHAGAQISTLKIVVERK